MIGERIKQARTAAGLSLRELAEKAGVSAMAISKYETGKSTPSSGVLLSLSKALGVPVEYFLRTERVELEEIEYRKHTKLPKKLLRQIEGDVIEQVERYLELEHVFPTLPIKPFKIPDGLPEHINDYPAIENVADIVRNAWDLGSNPIPELTDTLEEHGIKIFQTKLFHGNRFDGLAATVNGMPIIVVGEEWPGDRQRFTLAHELGHLLMKGRLSDALDEEKASNRFAGAFLVAKSVVFNELSQHRRWLEPQELCVLKKVYGLSMGGWIHRANDLGILADVHYQTMVRMFRARNWHKKEPCEEYPREKTQLFMQLVYHALAENLIGESKAAELLRVPLKQFHSLRNMERADKAAHQ
jgi:Zn-dependent peptidase ImmA (M78 family)/transcriptional regulator with XRE-family HTH domain